jgi:hypothetical protein
VAVLEETAAEVAANEACTAGDENVHMTNVGYDLERHKWNLQESYVNP